MTEDGPRVVLYTRVSTEEQVEHGYSLAGQARKLRAFASSEGWRVVEEVEDDGYSGADPYRPGLRRVMELAEAGAVDVVVAAKRDRLFRSRLYRLTFERDLKELGVELLALNDTGHRIGDGVLDDFAEWEREMIAERLHGGIRDMIRAGEVKAGPKPPYGYRHGATNKVLEVHGTEMAVVARIHRETAAGTSAGALVRALEGEGIPGPSGLPRWNKKSVANLIASDLYRPHSPAEVAPMVSEEVAATLEEGRAYALWVFNRRETTTRKEWDEERQRFVKRHSYRIRDRLEWLVVPIDVTDSGLSAATADRAREAARDRYREPSKAAGRFWELRGIAKCGECGSVLSPHTVPRKRADGSKARTFYYQCRRKFNNGARNCDHTTSYRAEELETSVWWGAWTLFEDPHRLRQAYEKEIERKRREARGADPEKLARELGGELERLKLRKSKLIDMGADGTISRADLRGKLAEIEKRRSEIGAALEKSRNRRDHMEALHRDIWLIWARFDQLRCGELRHLDLEGRRELYGALRLKADVKQNGTVILTGIFPEEISLPDLIADHLDRSRALPEPGDRHEVVVALGGSSSRR